MELAGKNALPTAFALTVQFTASKHPAFNPCISGGEKDTRTLRGSLILAGLQPKALQAKAKREREGGRKERDE